MQSNLDAKAFAGVSDSITQLLLLREVLSTSGLNCLPAPQTLQDSQASCRRTLGMCSIPGMPLSALRAGDDDLNGVGSVRDLACYHRLPQQRRPSFSGLLYQTIVW